MVTSSTVARLWEVRFHHAWSPPGSRLPCHHLHPQNGQACFFWGSWDCSEPGDRRCVAAWHMSLCACVSGLLEAVHGGTDKCHPKLGMGQPWNLSSCDDNQRASLALSHLPCGCLILWLDGASLGSSISPFPVCGGLSVASVSSSAWCFSCPAKRGRFFCKCGAESWLCPCSSEHSGFLLFPPSCQVGDSALWPAEGMEGVLVEGFAEHRKMSRNEQINTGECYPNTEELVEWLSTAALVSELSHTRSTHLLLWRIHGISMEKLGWSPRGNWSQDTPQGGDSKSKVFFFSNFSRPSLADSFSGEELGLKLFLLRLFCALSSTRNNPLPPPLPPRHGLLRMKS